MWNLQYATNEPIYKIEIDSQTYRLVAAEGLGVGRMNWEFGVSRCKLLHIEWNGQTTRSTIWHRELHSVFWDKP